MKKHSIKKRLRMIAFTGVVVMMSVSMTGCLDELLYEFLYEEDDWNENWWENPGAGGKANTDEWSSDEDFEWWCALDESWTIDDWEYTEDDLWMIYDEDSECTYMYDEESQQFAAMDMETEEIYALDMETGEWVPAE